MKSKAKTSINVAGKIRALLDKGLSTPDIARKLRIDRKYVYQIKWKAKTVKKGVKIKPENLSELYRWAVVDKDRLRIIANQLESLLKEIGA